MKKNRVNFDQKAAYSKANEFIVDEHVCIGCYRQSMVKKVFINVTKVHLFSIFLTKKKTY